MAKTILLIGLCAFMFSCKNETPQAVIVKINKKMPLIEWPDSSYISNLDSILKREPLKKEEKNKPNIAMNANKAPIFKLPDFVTGKKETSKAQTSKKTKQNAPKISNQSSESFIEKFSKALSALQSDPANANLYKVVTANDGEDLFILLKRTYGAGSQNLPRFYILSTLQSVNPGVALEHLKAGDKVRVPKL